ncbi:hypothetical protein PHPALM_29215 [Phytophthora palmivora]|uniref:Retrotransposon gag domain-containing protein n=1 Tax=Phytophthora palmivora TaxID=4796 RepID=A0A2P4X859_9STRA|nr:hypothetical protein PHPALM_29215 [Phytophthora palmivora]
MKVYELKTKMSPAVRNWYGQLSKHVRSEWSRLSKEFKREYCKSRVSESEKYYTMKQFKDETALAFLYHLNLAAERADVRFRKSERRREQHIKRFIKNLTDVTLKTTLQSQRFRKVSDLEYVLKQQEEVNPSGPRDFRADNVARNGLTMNRSNWAYIAQDDEAQGFDTQATFENDERADLGLIHEVYCVMNSVGWKPRDPAAGPRAPPRQPQQPSFRPNNPDRMEFCENCKKWGHRPENRWAVMVCDRCQRHGHPTQRCETKACLKCDQIHDGRCEGWRVFQEIKKLLKQGGLTDLPSHIREDILNGKGDSEGAQLNY